jgi:nucleotide-binding universal stress UspA family protein
MSDFAGMSKLLVPLDGSDSSLRAVPVAVRLARRLGLKVQLYTLVDDDAEVAAAEQSLEAVAADNLNGGEGDCLVEVGGDPVASIVAAAGDDAVPCMGTAASVRFHQGHFGSVAEGVVRALARPMFLVGPEMEPSPGSPTQKVVIPVDDSKLSESAIDPGVALAQEFGVPLWVVSVASPRQEGGADMVVGHSRYVHNLAAKLKREHPDLDVEYEALHDENPAEAIVRFVGDDGTAVMATHGRSGLSRLVAGSVATGVVARSKRAVVVFRPEAETE